MTMQSSSALFQSSSHPFDAGVFAHPHSWCARPTSKLALASPCCAPSVRCDTPEGRILQVEVESHYNVVLV